MRIRSVAVLTLAASAALAVSACGSLKQGIGLTKVVPDEFVTVSTAPLSVPPEYGLRPPAPGQPRPQELAPESAARQILLGQRQAVTRTPGEQVLVAQAGADQADPLARYVVDDEFGDIAHKDESFANRLMFWRKDDASTQAPTVRQTSEGQTTIDATTEAARLQALTGGQQAITITPRRSGGFKLPGL
ncbi:MAG: DUF3035 domain-containing protein [Alphaproteobacteria bacterium]|jgi:hypothetical protein|uniref:DUF3035 domain-containing protein n=1 Tax=Brevundimonas mediterranea TaxID=74329 RepID=A0A6G7EJL8_9CAUL|nr:MULTISPECIES: DUF3035 domain-containing protein [Brevundimonas]MBU1272601.1 DUF3035 domain-containing protein [Alphaproteobacteria bacterium]MDZ4317293.1 DUF3035 domain-containing protein [Phenylobacterium sp.]OGN46429.1 MAG: beta-barrel assembly machine subunit BamF [Caulobacterales bacterium RIFCSPHIGHO2_01_FULL_67_30]OYX79570.1 MAG: beta-barrel assembly machine subunit BamF [Brevundimonas sp. 32-68-21]EDX80499.1 hypothetical protein BBAL3_1656 [Brevundimonas sp. BAL3]